MIHFCHGSNVIESHRKTQQKIIGPETTQTTGNALALRAEQIAASTLSVFDLNEIRHTAL